MKQHKIFISAGEASGDKLAAELVTGLSRKSIAFKAFGICGPSMHQAGVSRLFCMSQLEVMGITAVIKKLPQLRMLQTQLLAQLDKALPDIAILVDYQEFHLSLGEQLRLRGIPVILYVAPQLWAWRPHRGFSLSKKVDHIMGVLPFEKEFFARFKVPFSYVGSPIYSRVKELELKNAPNKIPTKKIRLHFFPGSRESELHYILPTLFDTAQKISKQSHHYDIKINIAESFTYESLKRIFVKWSIEETILKKIFAKEKIKVKGVILSREPSLKMMREADFAVVTSGTAALECALIGTPLAVVYRTSFINYQIVKRLATVSYISLPNLIMNKEIIREFIQKINPADIASYIRLHCETKKYFEMYENLLNLRNKIKPHEEDSPASVVKRFLENMT